MHAVKLKLTLKNKNERKVGVALATTMVATPKIVEATRLHRFYNLWQRNPNPTIQPAQLKLLTISLACGDVYDDVNVNYVNTLII